MTSSGHRAYPIPTCDVGGPASPAQRNSRPNGPCCWKRLTHCPMCACSNSLQDCRANCLGNRQELDRINAVAAVEPPNQENCCLPLSIRIEARDPFRVSLGKIVAVFAAVVARRAAPYILAP